MRVVMLGQSGPYAPEALRALLRTVSGIELVLVVEGLRRGAAYVNRLLAAAPGPIPGGQSLRQVAAAAGAPTLLTTDINSAAAIEQIAEQRPDWLVCVGFDRLFVPGVVATARLGGINAHPSPLPQLRGPSPLFWCLRQGLSCSAITLHALDAKEDHGAVYAQRAFVLPPRATGAAIYTVAGRLAGQMLGQTLMRAQSQGLLCTPQDHALATRAPRPKAADCELVPGQWRCEALVNFACGAPFFAHPWIRIDGHVHTVRRGLEAYPKATLPGEMAWDGTNVHLACADGVAVVELIPPMPSGNA